VGFTADALSAVHRLSGGIPRVVNLVCDRALLAGFVKGSRRVTAAMVRQAGEEVAAVRPAPAFQWHHGLIATGLTLTLALLAFTFAPRLARAPAPSVGAVSPAGSSAGIPKAPPSPAPPPPSDRLDTILRTAPREASFASAAARVEAAWGGGALSRTTLRTHLDHLRALDLPVALEMFHPSRRDTCFVALLRLDERTAVVGAGDGPEIGAPRSQVDALWTRDAVVWWREPPDLAAAVRREAWVRDALVALGYGEPQLLGAVSRFQQATGLVPDGVPGPRTRMALFALSSGDRPRLAAGGRP
jgi:general secretion pathway protein A